MESFLGIWAPSGHDACLRAQDFFQLPPVAKVRLRDGKMGLGSLRRLKGVPPLADHGARGPSRGGTVHFSFRLSGESDSACFLGTGGASP